MIVGGRLRREGGSGAGTAEGGVGAGADMDSASVVVGRFGVSKFVVGHEILFPLFLKGE